MILQRTTNGKVMFDCPGCNMLHAIRVDPNIGEGPIWSWNKSMDKPTFQPSVLSTWTERGVDKVCHIFVTDGQAQILADCTQNANQTLPLKEMED